MPNSSKFDPSRIIPDSKPWSCDLGPYPQSLPIWFESLLEHCEDKNNFWLLRNKLTSDTIKKYRFTYDEQVAMVCENTGAQINEI